MKKEKQKNCYSETRKEKSVSMNSCFIAPLRKTKQLYIILICEHRTQASKNEFEKSYQQTIHALNSNKIKKEKKKKPSHNYDNN